MNKIFKKLSIYQSWPAEQLIISFSAEALALHEQIISLDRFRVFQRLKCKVMNNFHIEWIKFPLKLSNLSTVAGRATHHSAFGSGSRFAWTNYFTRQAQSLLESKIWGSEWFLFTMNNFQKMSSLYKFSPGDISSFRLQLELSLCMRELFY